MVVRTYYCIRYLYTFGMIVFGYQTIYLSGQMQFDRAFDPIFQTSLMYFGELICFLFIILEKKQSKPVSPLLILETSPSSIRQEPLVTWHERMGKSAYILISFFELINSCLEVLCFNFLSEASLASLQILATIFVLYYRIFHVNRKLFAHQKLGLSIFLIGMVLIITEVGVNRRESHEAYEIVVAISLMFLAEFFAALSLLTTESFMKRLDTSPSEVNTLKGLAGICMCLVLYFPIGLLLQIAFPESNYAQPLVENGKGMGPLIIVCQVVCFCLFNYFMISILKLSDTLSVCTINTGRVVVAWAVHVLVRFELIEILEVVGAFFVIIGLVVYNEVLVIPWLGMRESVKQSIKQNRGVTGMKPKKLSNAAFFLNPRSTKSLLKNTQQT